MMQPKKKVLKTQASKLCSFFFFQQHKQDTSESKRKINKHKKIVKNGSTKTQEKRTPTINASHFTEAPYRQRRKRKKKKKNPQ